MMDARRGGIAAGAAGALANMASTDRPVPQVMNQITHLQGAVKDLQDTVGQVYERLKDVMQQVPPKAETVAAPRPVLVPLADEIYNQAMLVQIQTEALQALLSRLEV